MGDWRAIQAVALATFMLACGGSSPTSPSAGPSPAPAPTGPRLLLAGQSGAFFLQPLLPGAIAFTNIDGSIDFWLNSPDFAAAARTPGLEAFVWWQGSADVAMSTEQYSTKLRSLITIARAGTATLPVRIVEIAYFPIRENIIEAQRQVSRDPGVELIPTADLPLDATNHITPAGNEIIRDRIYRSIGR